MVAMTFAVLRVLHAMIGDALNEIEGVYSAHGQSLEVIPMEEIVKVSSTEATALVSSLLSSPGTHGTDSTSFSTKAQTSTLKRNLMHTFLHHLHA